MENEKPKIPSKPKRLTMGELEQKKPKPQPRPQFGHGYDYDPCYLLPDSEEGLLGHYPGDSDG